MMIRWHIWLENASCCEHCSRYTFQFPEKRLVFQRRKCVGHDRVASSFRYPIRCQFSVCGFFSDQKLMASSALDFSSDRQMTPKNFALFGTRHFTHLSGGFFGSRRVGSLWIWGCCEVGKPDVEGDIINAHETSSSADGSKQQNLDKIKTSTSFYCFQSTKTSEKKPHYHRKFGC